MVLRLMGSHPDKNKIESIPHASLSKLQMDNGFNFFKSIKNTKRNIEKFYLVVWKVFLSPQIQKP